MCGASCCKLQRMFTPIGLTVVCFLINGKMLQTIPHKKTMNFPIKMWLSSRLVIILVMLVVAPLLNAPSGGIKAEFGSGVFDAWDSTYYLKIALSGYDYSDNAPGALVAFFPLYSLLIKGLTLVGIPAKAAGILLNNLAFLGTAIILYEWIKETQGVKTAQWVVLVLVWCPLSLFGTVIYTEGLYLFFTTAALWAFEKEKYPGVAIFGSLATATRVTGLAMIPAFILTAIYKKKGVVAYIASFASAGGVALYSLYCWYRFNDPLAFIHVQYTQWQRKTGIDYVGWWKMLRQITIGSVNTKAGSIVNLLHPVIFILICLIAYFLWIKRDKIPASVLDYGGFALLFLLWILAGDPLLNAGTVIGGIYLLWWSRQKLPLVVVLYGFLGIGLLIASGGTMSINRLVYGIVPLTIALGFLLERHKRWGYCTLGFFTVLLIIFSLRFAQELWVA